MTTKHPYSYVVLRYMHDVLTGEFVNVGLVMVAATEEKFLAKTRKTIGRIKHVFPDLDRDSFVDAMKAFDRGVRTVRRYVSSEGLFSDQKNAATYARQILPSDDSSLQWSPVGSGLSGNTDETFDRLFERFVGRYDTSSPKRKSDDDVWKPVRDMLTARGVDVEFQKKMVTGKADSIEFSRAWKNGSWHAYEPLSFDLADADGIKDKARKWRGHLAAVAEGVTDDIQLHLLIGSPENRSLLGAYRSAFDILEGIKGGPFNLVVVEESNLAELVNNIEDEVREHHVR
jgi:Protein of unknown function (DUF3037)